MKSFLSKTTLFIFSMLFVFSFSSCNQNKNQIVIDNQDFLSLLPSVSWAVVTEPYAAFRRDASWDSVVVDHCRYGDVLMVDGNAIMTSMINSAQKEIWYRFDKGWISETCLNVYQNKEKALKASKSMTK